MIERRGAVAGWVLEDAEDRLIRPSATGQCHLRKFRAAIGSADGNWRALASHQGRNWVQISYFGGAGLTRDALPAVRQFLALQSRAVGLHGNEKDDS